MYKRAGRFFQRIKDRTGRDLTTGGNRPGQDEIPRKKTVRKKKSPNKRALKILKQGRKSPRALLVILPRPQMAPGQFNLLTAYLVARYQSDRLRLEHWSNKLRVPLVDLIEWVLGIETIPEDRDYVFDGLPFDRETYLLEGDSEASPRTDLRSLVTPPRCRRAPLSNLKNDSPPAKVADY